MNLRLFIAFGIAIIATNASIASDTEKIKEIAHFTLPSETKKLLAAASLFGNARDTFREYCHGPFLWIPGQTNNCLGTIKALHIYYRHLSLETIKDNDLVELTAPFRPGFTDIQHGVHASETAQELYRKEYGLKKDPALRMYLDKNGELTRYYYEPNTPIDYVPTQTKQ